MNQTGTLPRLVLSAAVSLDGHLDDASSERLLLSNEDDFDRVDAQRAIADAILVGAGTIRADNPTLEVRSQERRQSRGAIGKAPTPAKVTITNSGNLDPDAKFFTVGQKEKLVYTTDHAQSAAHQRLGKVADIISTGAEVNLVSVLTDLKNRGYHDVMVEGGATIHSQFLAAGLVDELQLVIAPFILGGPAETRFIQPGQYPFGPQNPLQLVEVRQIDNVALLRYAAE